MGMWGADIFQLQRNAKKRESSEICDGWAKHPSIALIELISSLQKAKPIHAAACVVRGLIKTPETNTTIWYND